MARSRQAREGRTTIGDPGMVPGKFKKIEKKKDRNITVILI